MKNQFIFAVSLLLAGSPFAKAETIHAAVVVLRHGDRTWEGAPPTELTILGQTQCFDSGTFYRKRYIESTSGQRIDEISQTDYEPKQVYAAAPDKPLLVTTGQAFLQGLYPPKVYNKPISLANGQEVEDRVNGMQYSILHTIPSTDPNMIWLDGDEGCPKYLLQGQEYLRDNEFTKIERETDEFYDSLETEFLAGVFQSSEIGYQSAYSIFDYINVGSVHNSTIASKINTGSTTYVRLKFLADRFEWQMNGNVTGNKPALPIAGRTLASKVAMQLKSNMVSSGVKDKLSLLVTSHEAFMGFFGLANLAEVNDDFKALPNYASSMAFELYSSEVPEEKGYPKENELRVRFWFKNGTDAQLTRFAIFGNIDMSWELFESKVNEIGIKSVYEWCTMCSAGENFCPEPTKDLIGDPRETNRTGNSDDGTGDDKPEVRGSGNGGMKPVVAGVIGAIVAFVLALVLLGLAVAVFGLRFARSRQRFSLQRGFAGGEKLDSEIDLTRLTVPPPPPAALKL